MADVIKILIPLTLLGLLISGVAIFFTSILW